MANDYDSVTIREFFNDSRHAERRDKFTYSNYEDLKRSTSRQDPLVRANFLGDEFRWREERILGHFRKLSLYFEEPASLVWQRLCSSQIQAFSYANFLCRDPIGSLPVKYLLAADFLEVPLLDLLPPYITDLAIIGHLKVKFSAARIYDFGSEKIPSLAERCQIQRAPLGERAPPLATVPLITGYLAKLGLLRPEAAKHCVPSRECQYELFHWITSMRGNSEAVRAYNEAADLVRAPRVFENVPKSNKRFAELVEEAERKREKLVVALESQVQVAHTLETVPIPAEVLSFFGKEKK